MTESSANRACFIRVPRFRVKISLIYRNKRRYFHGLMNLTGDFKVSTPSAVPSKPFNNQTICVKRTWMFGIICNLVDARLRLVDAQSPKFFDELN